MCSSYFTQECRPEWGIAFARSKDLHWCWRCPRRKCNRTCDIWWGSLCFREGRFALRCSRELQSKLFFLLSTAFRKHFWRSVLENLKLHGGCEIKLEMEKSLSYFRLCGAHFKTIVFSQCEAFNWKTFGDHSQRCKNRFTKLNAQSDVPLNFDFFWPSQTEEHFSHFSNILTLISNEFKNAPTPPLLNCSVLFRWHAWDKWLALLLLKLRPRPKEQPTG